ncbi:19594_t:CDS:1, partial [Gigaspora margarita]
GGKVENEFMDDYPQYTVKVNKVLHKLGSDRTAKKVALVASMVAGTTSFGVAACLVPFTFGGSLFAVGAAGSVRTTSPTRDRT